MLIALPCALWNKENTIFWRSCLQWELSGIPSDKTKRIIKSQWQKQRKTVTTDKTVPEEKKTQLRCTKISGSEITKHNDKNMFKAIRRNWNYE